MGLALPYFFERCHKNMRYVTGKVMVLTFHGKSNLNFNSRFEINQVRALPVCRRGRLTVKGECIMEFLR